MSRAGIEGITWGVVHSRLYDSPNLAMDIGRFIFAGCIDAPDDIPGGGVRNEDYGPDLGDCPVPIEVPREWPTARTVSE